MANWITLLYTWNEHSIVYQQFFNLKVFFFTVYVKIYIKSSHLVQSFMSFDKCIESCNHHQTQSMDHHRVPFWSSLGVLHPWWKTKCHSKSGKYSFFATCLIFISHIESFEEDGVPSMRWTTQDCPLGAHCFLGCPRLHMETRAGVRVLKQAVPDAGVQLHHRDLWGLD